MNAGMGISVGRLLSVCTVALAFDSALGCGSAAGKPAMVTVDLASPREGQRSMSGFLSSIWADSPADEMIRLVRPQLFRMGLAEAAVLEGLDHPAARYQLVKELGAVYELNLGSMWGFPGSDWWSTRPKVKRFPPYEDFAAFRKFVAEVANNVKARELTPSQIVLEVWNEPDGNSFWPNAREPTKDPASEQRFFETYRVAERAIHGVLPSHDVAGPSWSWYDKSALQRFLDFCLAGGCEVNVLVWHEILMQPYKNTAEVEKHLKEVRQAFFENPKYAPLKLKEIHINEYAEAPEQYWPGETVAYLRALELGGADRASRSCWGELHGEKGMYGYENCNKGSLDGLVVPPVIGDNDQILIPGGTQPRAVWWVYRAYAAGVSSRVESTSSNPGIAVLASRDGLEEGSVQVLLGHVRLPLAKTPGKPDEEINRMQLIPDTQPAIHATVEFRNLEAVPQFARVKRVRARVYRIPNMFHSPNEGESVLEKPEFVKEINVDVIDGRAQLAVGTLDYQETLIVSLSPATTAEARETRSLDKKKH